MWKSRNRNEELDIEAQDIVSANKIYEIYGE